MTACVVELDKSQARCGDGDLVGAEACDDGNADDGDGCSSICAVEPGWACQGVPSTCSTTCGDGTRAGTESCDDADLGGASCGSEGYTDGVLQCDSVCSFDTSGCTDCGNGICEAENAEDCDNCQEDCGFVQLSVGYQFACACRADGTVWCWGDNSYGQLGHGLAVSLSHIPVQVVGIAATASQVDVAGEHACALLDDGTVDGNGVWCWGRNHFGQLASPDRSEHYTPTRVPDLGEMVQQVAVGWNHSCALLESGDVKCWGNNRDWRIGNCSIPNNDDSDVPVLVEGITNIVSISADGELTCALQDNTDALWCWGGNVDGQLGNGTLDATCIPTNPTDLPPIQTFVVGDHYTFVIENNGQAWSWGGNDWGQLGDTTDIDRQMPVQPAGVAVLRSVGLGWDHTCAVTQVGAVVCWGRNDSGQLGNGRLDNDYQPSTQVEGLPEGVRDALAGFEFSCALMDSGKIWCWGWNDFGQLGNGTIDNSVLPKSVLLP